MAAQAKQRRLLHVFSSFEVGGPQVRFCEIANRLGPGYHHTITAMDGNLDCATRLNTDVSWDTFPIRVDKSRGINVGNLSRFSRLLDQLRPDLLATYGWGAVEWGLVSRWRPIVPHLHFEDGFGPEESQTVQLRRRIYLRRIAFGKNTRVIVPSQTLWDIATKSWALAPNRLSLIPNGIDCERFSPKPDKTLLHKFGINPEGVVVGTVAALRPEKNLGRLIAAFARLKGYARADLIIAGEGSERSSLQTLAKAADLKCSIHFLGPVQHPEEIYGCFDIFAMSSDTEQMPISLLEAMACGLPVVATDVGDISAIVAPENACFIRECRDHQALAHNLKRLATDVPLRADLGMRNRARVCSEFAFPRMLARYKALFS